MKIPAFVRVVCIPGILSTGNCIITVSYVSNEPPAFKGASEHAAENVEQAQPTAKRGKFAILFWSPFFVWHGLLAV